MSWALRRTFARKRSFVILVIALGIGGLVGFAFQPSGAFATDDTRYFKLWELLDSHLITFLIPFATLVFVAQGFSREISQRTLVYQLVTPVRRSTLYLAQYVGGVIPAIIVCILGLSAAAFASGVDVPRSVFVAIAAASVVGVLALGSLYYLLSAVFRHGLIAGLLYTFLFEVSLSFTKSAALKVSVTHYLRSLIRGLVNDDFVERSVLVRDAVSPEAADVTVGDVLNDLMATAGEVVYVTPMTAVAVLLSVTAVLLTIGVIVIRRRDFALKD